MKLIKQAEAAGAPFKINVEVGNPDDTYVRSKAGTEQIPYQKAA